jgi:mono/diheme cytochrome c family protein
LTAGSLRAFTARHRAPGRAIVAGAAGAGWVLRSVVGAPASHAHRSSESIMKLLVSCLLLCLALPVTAAELTVDLGHGVHRYSTAQLLTRADVRTVSIPVDVAFRRPMQYRAIPLRAVLDRITPTDHLQFVANDGFTAEIPAAALLDPSHGEPWLAIEDPARPWPALPENHGTAGPFYVVWTQMQATPGNAEQWPYQLVSIRKLGSVAERFPALLPAASLPADSVIRRGFAVFTQTCLACHTLNRQGSASLGPDLNVPHNPTEYLRSDLLRAYIRNPQSLRYWPTAKMPGLDARTLPDADLDAVVAYLQHMAGRKASSVRATAADATGPAARSTNPASAATH